MAQEIELKFRVSQPAAARRRLAALGAESLGQVLERNELFDAANDVLRSSDCGLRLRVERRMPADASGSRATLTYKGPRRASGAGTVGEPATAGPKVREELETEVADAGVLRAILQRLGFSARVCFEKRREAWRLPAGAVTLDELPRLGYWMELEADSLDALQALREQMELAAATPVAQTYVEMAQQAGRMSAAGVAELVFDDSPSADAGRADP